MKSKRILVVEDDPVTCEVIQVVLEDFGFELMTVHDSEQAMQVARDAPPDLVLLDLSLPGSDALELCATLKRESATHGSAVVLMTHQLSEEELASVGTSLTRPVAGPARRADSGASAGTASACGGHCG